MVNKFLTGDFVWYIDHDFNLCHGRVYENVSDDVCVMNGYGKLQFFRPSDLYVRDFEAKRHLLALLRREMRTLQKRIEILRSDLAVDNHGEMFL